VTGEHQSTFQRIGRSNPERSSSWFAINPPQFRVMFEELEAI